MLRKAGSALGKRHMRFSTTALCVIEIRQAPVKHRICSGYYMEKNNFTHKKVLRFYLVSLFFLRDRSRGGDRYPISIFNLPLYVHRNTFLVVQHPLQSQHSPTMYHPNMVFLITQSRFQISRIYSSPCGRAFRGEYPYNHQYRKER